MMNLRRFSALLMGGLVLSLGMKAAAQEAPRNPFWFDKCDVFQLKDAERLRAIRTDVKAYFAAHPSTEPVHSFAVGRENALLLAAFSTWSVLTDGGAVCSNELRMCTPVPAAWVPQERRAPGMDLLDPVDWALSESSATADWRTYEDTVLRFSHPPSWDVHRSSLAIIIGQEGKARAPTLTKVQVRWPMEPGTPSLSMERALLSGSVESLDTRATYRVGSWHTLGWHLLAGVENPYVMGGTNTCVLYAMETPRSISEKSSGEMWESHRAIMEMECRRPNGDLVFVSGLPSNYSQSKAVGPEDGAVREQLALFKRLLCGMSFR